MDARLPHLPRDHHHRVGIYCNILKVQKDLLSPNTWRPLAQAVKRKTTNKRETFFFIVLYEFDLHLCQPITAHLGAILRCKGLTEMLTCSEACTLGGVRF